MEAMDIQAVESKLSDVTVTAVPMPKPSHNNYQCSTNSNNNQNNEKQLPSLQTTISSNNSGLSKYAQLLGVIEEMGRDVRPTYSGSKSSAERLKRGIIHARILVRECLVETERSARQ